MRAYLVAGLVTVTLVTSPHAAVLCVTRNGSVKIRDACKPRETQADPIALGLQGSPGPQGAKGDKGDRGASGTPGYVVRDANGVLVGPLYVGRAENGDDGAAVISAGSALVVVPFDASGIRGGRPDVLFESTDCTGPPFVSAVTSSEHPLLTGFSVGVVNTTLVYATGPALAKHLLSRVTFPAAGCGAFLGGCCSGVNDNLAVQTANAFDFSTLGFVPPFHVEGP